MMPPLLTLVFSISLMVGAGLLFSVQPMVGKMMLPMLGGAPAVWTTAMVFFQSALLVGYVYAFLSSRYLALRAQVVLHLAALFAALGILPIAISDVWGSPDLALPQLWLLTVLLGVVALPFVIVAGSSTLLQNWFAHSNHPRASDPYFLYATSNLGSIVALLAYPFLIEPRLTVALQSRAWTMLYLTLIGLSALCGASVWRSSGARSAVIATTPPPDASKPASEASTSWNARLQWLSLSLAPSMMLFGVTLHIQTDVAAIPFLWIAPLAVYLLTFIFSFYRVQLFSRELTLNLHALSLILVSLFLANFQIDYAASIVLHLALLFFSGMVCHGALAGMRPDTAHLGEFYLWVSAGGWLGGLAGGLLAPLLFDSVLEYPIAIIAVCLLRGLPPTSRPFEMRRVGLALATIGFFASFNPWFGLKLGGILFGIFTAPVLYGGLLAGMFSIRKSALLLTAVIGIVMLGMKAPGLGEELIPRFQKRSFFGVTKVADQPITPATILFSGTTLHGFQLTKSAKHRRLSTGFYHSSGPIGHVIRGKRKAGALEDVAIIGLGSGTIACQFRRGEGPTFLEVDPVVVEVATTPELFTFMSECGADATVKLGDGRLLVSEFPDDSLDLLIVDAFSSDAIPVHLITQEALRLYFRKLASDGALALHITNRHLDLAPVLARAASAEGWSGSIWHHDPGEADTERTAVLPSRWVVLTRDPESLRFLNGRGPWLPIESAGLGDLWTDDFSNVMGTMGSYE